MTRPHRQTSAGNIQRLAFAGALGVAVIAVLPIGPAAANGGDLPPANLGFSGAATAIGTQAMVNTNPEPSSVGDTFDLQVPAVNSVFDSSGQSDATSHLANGNGAGQVPGLLCLAADVTLDPSLPHLGCSGANTVTGQIPTVGTLAKLPLDDPITAHASYPKPTDDAAPKYRGVAFPTAFGSDQGALVIGTATAHADLRGVDTNATSAAMVVPDAISSGATSAVSEQKVVKGAFITRASSRVSDISIGGAAGLQVGSVTSVADVTSTPGKKAVDKSSVTVSNVTFAGQAATIDNRGLHISNVPDAAIPALLLRVGVLDVKIVGTNSTDDDSGHGATAQGLLVRFDTSVTGLPVQGLPAQVTSGCSSAIKSFTDAGLPNACNGVGANPNAEYYGQALFAQAGVQNLAFKDDSQSTISDPPFDSGVLDPGISNAADPPRSGSRPTAPVANVVPRAPSTVPGTTNSGFGVTGPASTDPGLVAAPGALDAPAQPPQLAAARPVTRARLASVYGEDLNGLDRRLLWVYPAILLSGVGILAGRFGRAPSRIPGA
jgi:hypothetical protein